MKKFVPLLILTLSACANQQHRDVSYRSEVTTYLYHEDGVICYGLSYKGIVVESGGECISMLRQSYLNKNGV